MSEPITQSVDFDAIVIGSGMTGGWAAKELSEKGLKVLVLERGRYIEHGKDYVSEHMPPWRLPYGGKPLRELYAEEYPIQSTVREFDESNRHFWNNDKNNPYVFDPDKPFMWRRADVLGGRSLLWTRQVYRWSDLDFEANQKDGNGIDWPIRYTDIAPWYSHVEKFIGVSGQKLGLDHLPDGEFQPPMQMNVVELALKERIERHFPDRVVTIGRAAVLTEALDNRAACHYCGRCDRGCSPGSYFSSLSSTLPAAHKTGNLTIRADAVVESLDYDTARQRVSGVRVIDAKTGARNTYGARLVFLCASAIASAQILLNSRSDAFPNGLANRSGAVGRYLMDHAMSSVMFGIVPGFMDRYYEGNRPNNVYIPRFRNLPGKKDEHDFVRGYGYQALAQRMDWSTLATLVPGFGVALKQALRVPGPWVFGGVAFCEHLPHADNRMTLDAARPDRFGIPQVRFDVVYRDNERKLLRDAAAQGEAMMKAAGLINVATAQEDPIPGNAIHEMGTARMGHDPAESVLNAWNQAHDVANLFVTDGACMTSSSCVNPSLTYMALTARAADYAVKQLQEGRV